MGVIFREPLQRLLGVESLYLETGATAAIARRGSEPCCAPGPRGVSARLQGDAGSRPRGKARMGRCF